MWIRPLQAELSDNTLTLYAPNRFVLDWVRDKYLIRVNGIINELCGVDGPTLRFDIGNRPHPVAVARAPARGADPVNNSQKSWESKAEAKPEPNHKSNTNVNYTFENFVEGKSNQLARAAARQVADNPGGAYNPLFLYGGTGLGKTHLLHAVGNAIKERKQDAKVIYKEEFFHTFNALLEGNQQIILTSDRYPKEINGVEDRLKSRFGWGLTVAIEPPELETRVAILMRKADENQIHLPDEVAFFIAKRLRSNVRELEGALNRVIANANFTGRAINIDFVREALRDLLALQEKLVTIDNIQKTVAEYYKIKLADLLSKRRSRSVARPRQLAMALASCLPQDRAAEGRESRHQGRLFQPDPYPFFLTTERSGQMQFEYSNLIRTFSS